MITHMILFLILIVLAITDYYLYAKILDYVEDEDY